MSNYYFYEGFSNLKIPVTPIVKEKLNSDNVDIELQFKENYELLLITSYTILKDKNIACDIVQDFFEYYINKSFKQDYRQLCSSFHLDAISKTRS